MAIKPDLGALEPCKRMDCMDVTVGRFLISETPPAALCHAIIILRGDGPFFPFEILMVGI